MKTFTFNTYPSKRNAQGIEVVFDPKMILHGIVVTAPQGQGFTLDMMRKRLRIADVLEKTEGETVTLEDADHAQLCDILNNFHAFLGGEFIKEVIEMCDAVLKARDVAKDKKAAEA